LLASLKQGGVARIIEEGGREEGREGGGGREEGRQTEGGGGEIGYRERGKQERMTKVESQR